jgi:hypothetical protein
MEPLPAFLLPQFASRPDVANNHHVRESESARSGFPAEEAIISSIITVQPGIDSPRVSAGRWEQSNPLAKRAHRAIAVCLAAVFQNIAATRCAWGRRRGAAVCCHWSQAIISHAIISDKDGR